MDLIKRLILFCGLLTFFILIVLGSLFLLIRPVERVSMTEPLDTEFVEDKVKDFLHQNLFRSGDISFTIHEINGLIAHGWYSSQNNSETLFIDGILVDIEREQLKVKTSGRFSRIRFGLTSYFDMQKGPRPNTIMFKPTKVSIGRIPIPIKLITNNLFKYLEDSDIKDLSYNTSTGYFTVQVPVPEFLTIEGVSLKNKSVTLSMALNRSFLKLLSEIPQNYLVEIGQKSVGYPKVISLVNDIVPILDNYRRTGPESLEGRDFGNIAKKYSSLTKEEREWFLQVIGSTFDQETMGRIQSYFEY